MFEISEETRTMAIEAMRDIIGKHGVSDQELEEAFEMAVKIVKQQFGF